MGSRRRRERRRGGLWPLLGLRADARSRARPKAVLLAILTSASDQRLPFRDNRLMTCGVPRHPIADRAVLGRCPCRYRAPRPRSVVAGALWLMELGGGKAARRGAAGVSLLRLRPKLRRSVSARSRGHRPPRCRFSADDSGEPPEAVGSRRGSRPGHKRICRLVDRSTLAPGRSEGWGFESSRVHHLETVETMPGPGDRYGHRLVLSRTPCPNRSRSSGGFFCGRGASCGCRRAEGVGHRPRVGSTD